MTSFSAVHLLKKMKLSHMKGLLLEMLSGALSCDQLAIGVHCILKNTLIFLEDCTHE